jgi:hypothetical protein
VHPVLKPIIGTFAVIGIAYCAFAVFATLFLMDCTFTQAAQAISPNGEHFAVFEQRICKDPDKSWSRVLTGKRGAQERSVLMELRGTTEVGLTWDTDHELIVSYPRAAVVKKYDTGSGPFRVTLRPTDPAM